MHAYDLRKTNKSAFQRGTQNEGRDAGGSELIILLGIQALLAGGRTYLVHRTAAGSVLFGF